MSTATAPSLGSQGHLGVGAAGARPRTRSFNSDHAHYPLSSLSPPHHQHQHQHQQHEPPSQSELHAAASSPTSAALDQILSDLSHHQPTSSSSASSSFHSNKRASFHGESPSTMDHASPQEFNSYPIPDSLLAMSSLSHSNGNTPPATKTSFGLSSSNNSSSTNLHQYYSTAGGGNSHSGNSHHHSGLTAANANGSIGSLGVTSPLQHRPHTPSKSSFPLSITSDYYPSDSVAIPSASTSNVHTGGHSGGSGAVGSASSSASDLFESIAVNSTPSTFNSLSTKTGRRHFGNEKHLGPLPTMHSPTGRERQETATIFGVSMKHLSLVVLLLQNSVLVLMMRFSRVSVDPDQPMYLASTAVFIAEIIKLCTCFMIIVYRKRSLSRTITIVRQEIIGQPQEILKMLVPSGLYALQNNLLYIALSNLEAATFQVTYQMKILSTAIFSVVMLNRRLTRQKWLSLCLLMVGVTLVQLQNVGTGRSPVIVDNSQEDEGDSEFLSGGMGDGGSETADALVGGSEDDASQNPIIGLLAVLTSCVSSGFAGCYFEKILKGSESDMWVRNLQLGISGSLFSFLAMFYDRQRIYEGGIFQGYSMITWMVITNQALGGLLVAIVVKYADNILKGFATSLSIIVSGMISVYFFDFEPSLQFQLGTLVVILATFLYGRPDAPIPRFVRRQKK
ncbi:hypothetical protein BGZ99_004445 [Dissophora globulifera]|uniref:Uncharacterized protein n=1 Tax=Dissophora globulifera TaxID=979702 RepID=A0A9P6RM20_9FUNG|nr:hypothetical protein BGZ99_004445 [Dissophora globulifera]